MEVELDEVQPGQMESSRAAGTTPSLLQDSPSPNPSYGDILRKEMQNTPIPNLGQLKIKDTPQGPALILTDEQWSSLNQRYANLSVHGRFLSWRPEFAVIRKYFQELGLRRAANVRLLSNRYLQIDLECREDYEFLLDKAHLEIGNSTLVLTKWTPDFNPHIEPPTRAVWVQLLDVPPAYGDHPELLKRLVKTIGYPIKFDRATENKQRPSLVRALVEVDCGKQLLKSVWVGRERALVDIKVEYENPPQYCSTCRMFGHSLQNCKKSQEPNKEVGREDNRFTPQSIFCAHCHKKGHNKEQCCIRNPTLRPKKISSTVEKPKIDEVCIQEDTVVQEHQSQSAAQPDANMAEQHEGDLSVRRKNFTTTSDQSHTNLLQESSFPLNMSQMPTSFTGGSMVDTPPVQDEPAAPSLQSTKSHAVSLKRFNPRRKAGEWKGFDIIAEAIAESSKSAIMNVLADEDMQYNENGKRKAGRPPGSKNKKFGSTLIRSSERAGAIS